MESSTERGFTDRGLAYEIVTGEKNTNRAWWPQAEAMLGYAYGLRGAVVSGKQLGRTLGFPTANLRLYDPLKLVPARGVYLTEVEVLGGHYRGMTNVAEPIETHIFDFSEDIYGLDLEIRFRRWMRAMRPFDSLDALAAQLAADEAACRALI